jgi:hypothetical protein
VIELCYLLRLSDVDIVVQELTGDCCNRYRSVNGSYLKTTLQEGTAIAA